MRISDLLNKEKPTISFEVFPPKTDVLLESVLTATQQIAALKPAFVSVTYGAGGGTSAYTLEIAKKIQETSGVPTLAHLTCVSSSKETVHQQIQKIQNAGIENVMALRGDLTPQLEQTDRSTWDYRYAVELVRDIRRYAPDLCLGGACYPEIHPESPNQKTDLLHLKEKVDEGIDFLTTQMFFDNNLFYNFLYKAREAGIYVPILPGIMPITSAKQIERAIKLSGSFMPRRFTSLVDKFGTSPEAMKQAGIIYAADQIIDLYANGITHVHVYSMNKPDVAKQIMTYLSSILSLT